MDSFLLLQLHFTMRQKKEYLELYLIQTAKIKRLSEMSELYSERKSEFDEEIRAAENFRRETEEKIRRVDGGILSELLFFRYVCGKSLLETSFCLNYSLRHTDRLYKKALELFKI